MFVSWAKDRERKKESHVFYSQYVTQIHSILHSHLSNQKPAQSGNEDADKCVPDSVFFGFKSIHHLLQQAHLALIKSISGFRGTIGGKSGDNLTPIDIVECTAAYGQWLLSRGAAKKVVIGRDARQSGKIVSQLVAHTLQAMGISTIDLSLSTTPTVEMAVVREMAGGGIILTASHNPGEWNALKLLNERGEFISAADGQAVINFIGSPDLTFAPVDQLGGYEKKKDAIATHISEILSLNLVNTEAIKNKKFRVVVDCVNSTGSLAIPPLLEALGCTCELINGTPDGHFAHNPEPLPQHLTQLSEEVKNRGADLGIAVDPDVDRLALVCEDGSLFGEEYTLVAVADYVLKHTPGATVSNLSSSRALRDVTEAHGQQHSASAVGEVNVVELMKSTGAVIGGEGNGGIIYPPLHYGRDALVGIALFLSHLAAEDKPMTALRAAYPSYAIVKNKLPLESLDLEQVFERVRNHFAAYPQNTIDGLKIDLPEGWIHLRQSNTEPIVRIYTEARDAERAQSLAEQVSQAARQDS
jgi:phosphomannomutase